MAFSYTMALDDHTGPHGRVALMLCESLIHVLVEVGVIRKTTAMQAIDTVVELTREMTEADPSVINQTAVDLVTEIAESFVSKSTRD
jgi:hypothetical protein